ncbi:tuftelin-interacting protein 11 [Microdochium nivale]|nr:tuftelin-interacting protein 11 [Microdochium nivale]
MDLHDSLLRAVITDSSVPEEDKAKILLLASSPVDDAEQLHLAHEALTTLTAFIRSRCHLTLVQQCVLQTLATTILDIKPEPKSQANNEALKLLGDEGTNSPPQRQIPVMALHPPTHATFMRATAISFIPSVPWSADVATKTSQTGTPLKPQTPTSQIKKSVVVAEAQSDDSGASGADTAASPVGSAQAESRKLRKSIKFRKQSSNKTEVPAPPKPPPRPDSPVTEFLKSNTLNDASIPGRENALKKAYGLGTKLLQKSGWQVGQGLGPTGEGIKEPVFSYMSGRYGLGSLARDRADNGQSGIFNTSNTWRKSRRFRQDDFDSEGQTYEPHAATGPPAIEDRSSRLIDDSPDSGDSGNSAERSWVSMVAASHERQVASGEPPNDNTPARVLTFAGTAFGAEQTPHDDVPRRQVRISQLQLRPSPFTPDMPTWEVQEERRDEHRRGPRNKRVSKKDRGSE